MDRSRLAALLRDAPVFDGHNDLPWELRVRGDQDLDRIDLDTDLSGTGLHTDLVRMRAGGVGAQFWSVFVPASLGGDAAVTATLEQIDLVRRMVARYPDRLTLATTADQVEAARAAGRIASLIGIEGGHSINGSLAVLRMMHTLGARYLTLTHASNTPWADSATDAPAAGGLTDFGRRVVAECNRLGMLVDLSHVAVTTMNDALDTTTAPAFFSHSSARALCDHPRDVPDEVLRRVRDTNGVVMVTFVPGFINEPCRAWTDRLVTAEERIAAEHPDHDARFSALVRAWVRDNPRPPCPVSNVADHVDHIREVAGVNHIGLGGDFDGIVTTPDGLPDVAAYPNLLAELASRGWSDTDLAKLTWRNALRVLRDTESCAGPLLEQPARE